MTRSPSGSGPGRFSPPSLVAGIGCTSRAGADEIVALVEACLDELGRSPDSLLALSSHVRKSGHAGLIGAARHFGVPLRLLSSAGLATDMPHPSARAIAATGLPSVAEAAAAASGPLLLAKRRSAQATCALALAPAQPVRAAMAASTLSTSSAGP